jgi:hypothetical protein
VNRELYLTNKTKSIYFIRIGGLEIRKFLLHTGEFFRSKRVVLPASMLS